ncbi:MAG TPA: carboxypeptidase-like regulatory domain-containing protein [Vicinamibacterales bacterium]|nr:carboxypeptidase-like regulatory domain-containing protein [Vicinamibacterales bacterium]
MSAASILWCVTLLALLPRTSVAQYNTAEISGVVKDTQGALLPGAIVTAVDIATRATVERTTDQSGRFLLPALAVGSYDLSVTLEGFKRFARRGLALQVGQKIDLPVTLEIGAVEESVVVGAEIPLLQTANAEVSDVIGNRQVTELALNGRQFLQLAQLTDGVAIPPGGTRGGALEQAGSLPAVQGQRSGHNIYLLDGVKVTDEYFNNLVVSPSIDAIQEFKIDKTMYPPEFGGKSAALVNIVTRSGSNTFHGGGLAFVRDSAFDSRNAFDDPNQPVPPLHQRQFGLSVGGPVDLGSLYHGSDRTFFFLSYEGQRAERSLTQTFSVPPAAQRAGNFAGLAPLIDPTTGQPFPNNQIPASRLDPVAVALLDKVPLPTGAGSVQNLLAVAQETNPINQATLRMDHRVTARDQLFGRFSWFDVTDDQPFGTSSLNETLVPGFGRQVHTGSLNLGVSETHTFGDRVLNELRFGWLSVGGGQVSPNQGVNFAAVTGLKGVTTNAADTGYPQVSFGGLYSTIGDPTAFVSRENRSYELYDNVTVNRGDHEVKFGGYLFRLDFNPVLPNTARGAFTFTGQFSGNALADFLLGDPTSGQAGIGRAAEQGRSTWFHVYGQDDWHATSRLTLNYGLRYEINGQMNDIDNQLSAIDLSAPGGRFVIASDDQGTISPAAQPLLSQIPIPYVSSSQAGWTAALLRPSYLRFAPRVGGAWSVAPGTVVRGGFGIFLNQWAYSVQQAFAQNLPFFQLKTINAPSDTNVPPYQTDTMLLASGNGTIGGSTMDHDFQTEYAKNATASVQREVAVNTTVEVSYLWSGITGADSSTVLNVPQPGPGAIGPRRPVPQLANISEIRWNGYSNYNGVTFKISRRFSHGLSYSANYTLSKAIDDASDPGATVAETNLPQNVYDLSSERAPSSFDHRHRFVANVIYALPDPEGDGVLSALGRDWQVTGIATLQSGSPFTVNLGTDVANIGSGPAQRPNVSCDPNSGGARTSQQWFNTSCFSLPAPFTFGNSGRNTVLAPGYADVDLGVQRSVRLSQGAQLQLRWEIFNLFDRVNFDTPNRTAFTANFGRIFSAQPARQMQVGVKLIF